MRAIRFLFSLLAISLCFSPLALAQITNVTADQAPPIHGAGHDYIHLLNETVNPATGAVSVRINVQVPPGRGLAIPFSFGYDSNAAQHKTGPTTYQDNSSYVGRGGWSYVVPILNVSSHQITWWQTWSNGQPLPPAHNCTFYNDYVLQAIDGSTHNLGLAVFQNNNSSACAYPITQPSDVLSGGDGYVQAVNTSYANNQVTVSDASGTVYSFPNIYSYTYQGGWLPNWIETRNGDKAVISATTNGAFTITDTLGRGAISSSGFGATGNTIAVSGLSNPYTVTWGTANTTWSGSAQVANEPGTTGTCVGSANPGGSSPAITMITLPNNQTYQFQYDPVSGLLSKLIYPGGAYVRYVWGINSLSDSLDFYPDDQGHFTCHMLYDTQAVSHRYVSFDGVHEVQQQDFTYTTPWVPSGCGACQTWTNKTTTVVTHDLLRGTAYQTSYTYGPYVVAPGPYDESYAVKMNGSCQLSCVVDDLKWGQAQSHLIPVENTLAFSDTNNSLLRTSTKGWLSQFLLGCELQTLDNNLISGTFYTYGTGAQMTDKKDYDYSLITSASACQNGSTAPSGITPSRETAIAYQGFANTPIYPSGPSIFDRPSTVITYGNGTRAAETDYTYDNYAPGGITPVTASGHDDSNYSASYTNRGNATSVTRQCFPSCTNAITSYTFDQTGQVRSATDPNVNATQYSYLDNFDSNPSTATNALVTQITYPPTNGVSHIQKYKYAYSDSQPIQSTDQNNQVTSYFYADSLRRLTETDYADGGKTTVSYSDTAPSPTVTTSRLMNSSNQYVTSTSIMDGIGHVVQSQLTSDPTGTDYTDTTYDGLGRVWKQSNPHRATASPTDGTTTFIYDALGRTTQVTHPDNATALTAYTGRATQVQDEGNGTQRIQRVSQTDGLGQLMSVCEVTSTSQLGNGGSPAPCGQDFAGTGFLTTYLYDGLGNLKQVSQAGMNLRNFIYDSLSRLTSATNPESNTIPSTGATLSTTYTYDPNGNIVSKTSPAPNQNGTATVTLSYCYDALNRLTSKAYTVQSCPMTSPVATFNYDETSALGVTNLLYTTGRASSSFVKNTQGLIQAGGIFSYDPIGRVKINSQCTPQNCGAAVFPLNYTYDLGGNLLTSTNGTGVTLTSLYNTATQLQSFTSSLSDTNHPGTLLSNPTYNPLGGMTSVLFGNGITESRAYASRGWLQTSSATGGTSTPGTGSVTISGTEKSTQLPANPATGSVTISGTERKVWYCPAGGCFWLYDTGTVSITVNGFTKSTSYGQNSTSSSLALALTNAFNGDSASPVTATVSGSTITLTTKLTGAGVNYSFSASSATNNPSHFSGTSFPVSTSGATLTGGTNAQTVYDTGTVSITVNGSAASSYTYGQTDTPTSIAAGLVSHLSSPFVNATSSSGVVTLTAKTSGSGTNYPLAVSVTFDTTHFSSASFTATPSGATLTGGTDNTLYSLNLSSYAPNGDILGANDTVNGNWTYTYDPFNRLLGSNKNSGAEVYSYEYDRFGNRWHQNGPHSSQLGFDANNRMTGVTGVGYDSAGNLISDGTGPGTHTYFYDAENHLIQVDGTLGTCSTATACYVYNAAGQRVRRTTGSTSVDFLYDLGGQVITELSSTGVWNRGEVYAGGRHLVTYSGGVAGTTYFNHGDWLGTERFRTDKSGATYETCSSLPFGDALTCSGSDVSTLHFTGKERDSESGLDHFHFRKFSSATGRFMIPDPAGMMAVDIGNPQTLDRYSYVLNNPLAFTDPFGLDCVYLNSSGTGIEKNGVDQHSNSKACGKTGGYWMDGTVTSVTIGGDAETISLLGTTNGTDQTKASYQQDAVVTVGEYNNTSLNPYNHIALGLAGQRQLGQHPRSDARFLWALSVHGPTASVPGVITPQVGGRLLQMVRIRATGMQAQMLQDAMNQSAQNPPPYTLTGETGCDCGTWAQMMLGDAGINSGPPGNIFPDMLMQQLNALYPQQQ